MIYVDRNLVTKPFILSNDSIRVDEALDKLRSHYQSKASRGAGVPFDWSIHNDEDVIKALKSLFHNKCAYCESPIMVCTVDHFRPKYLSINLNGTVDADRYWWLAYEWSNLYMSCYFCNMNKGTRFPVAGERAEPETPLEQETTLLLDPCQRADFGNDHLIFLDDGSVVCETDKGKMTIDVFGLNREYLLNARRKAIQDVVNRLDLQFNDLTSTLPI